MTKRAALVLDFGGVMSRTLFETHRESEAALGLPAGSLTWRGPFAPETDLLWQAMQAGQLSERDYWLRRSAEVGKLLGEEWHDMQTLVRRARGAAPEHILRPEAVAAITQAKQSGYKLAILSNELDLFYGAQLRQQLPILNLFDVIVDATYTQILKPDVRAYQAVCDALDLPSSACVFVDDQLKNIVGAQAVGMHTVHFDVQQPAAMYQHALTLLEQL